MNESEMEHREDEIAAERAMEERQEKIEMTTKQKKLAKIFNEWAKRYAKNPDEFTDILDKSGKPFKDYGSLCAAYFEKLETELGK